MRREDKRLEYGWFYGKLFTLGKHNEFKITGERDEKISSVVIIFVLCAYGILWMQS